TFLQRPACQLISLSLKRHQRNSRAAGLRNAAHLHDDDRPCARVRSELCCEIRTSHVVRREHFAAPMEANTSWGSASRAEHEHEAPGLIQVRRAFGAASPAALVSHFIGVDDPLCVAASALAIDVAYTLPRRISNQNHRLRYDPLSKFVGDSVVDF